MQARLREREAEYFAASLHDAYVHEQEQLPPAPVMPSNESSWNAVGYYRAHGKNYVVLRRDGVTRTVIDPKEAKYEEGRIDFKLDGLRVAGYTGRMVAPNSLPGGKL